MAKPFLRAFAAAVAVLGALAAIGGLTFYFLNSPSPAIPAEGRFFRVQKGESLSLIAARLKEEGLLRSPLLIKVLARLTGSELRYKSGFFRIRRGDTALDIHTLLVSGYQEQIKVTIPEGWTLKQIARHLESRGVVGRDSFLAAASSPKLLRGFRVPAESLEGYLYPDTYFFPAGYPAEAVVEQMAVNFFDHLKLIAPEAAGMSPRELHERLTVASIVEREYRRAEEAPLIASVFYNRLRYNIGLESCATLEYIITDIEDRPHPPFLTAEDKKIDSPYNTYKWAGLPPGPISNPGRVALEAALRPARTGYFYFVLKDPESGTHYFSESLKQHNWAKYLYLKQVGAGS
jgi:UPF0755 protein